jgi:hypothetical protein
MPVDFAPLAYGSERHLSTPGQSKHSGLSFFDQGANRCLTLPRWHAVSRRLDLGGIERSNGGSLAARGETGAYYFASCTGPVAFLRTCGS